MGRGCGPARLDDLFADRAQGMSCAVEVGLGSVVFMVGQKLRQIARPDQGIDRPGFAAQALDAAHGGSRNDAVVGGDLGVVPGARTALRIKVWQQTGQRRVRLGQCGNDTRCFAMLTVRQIAAITARVCDDLVGFIQRLGYIEGFLCTEPELFRADFLQGAKVERQWCGLTYPLGAQLDQPGAGSSAHGLGGLLRQWLIQAARHPTARATGR